MVISGLGHLLDLNVGIAHVTEKVGNAVCGRPWWDHSE
jgi:hypothetical protein